MYDDRAIKSKAGMGFGSTGRPMFLGEEQCDFIENAVPVYFKKQKKTGEWYNGCAIKGDRCEEAAIVTQKRGTKTVRRCVLHIAPTTLQD